MKVDRWLKFRSTPKWELIKLKYYGKSEDVNDNIIQWCPLRATTINCDFDLNSELSNSLPYYTAILPVEWRTQGKALNKSMILDIA